MGAYGFNRLATDGTANNGFAAPAYGPNIIFTIDTALTWNVAMGVPQAPGTSAFQLTAGVNNIGGGIVRSAASTTNPPWPVRGPPRAPCPCLGGRFLVSKSRVGGSANTRSNGPPRPAAGHHPEHLHRLPLHQQVHRHCAPGAPPK